MTVIIWQLRKLSNFLHSQPSVFCGFKVIEGLVSEKFCDMDFQAFHQHSLAQPQKRSPLNSSCNLVSVSPLQVSGKNNITERANLK
jgi:hypothetical protein